MKKISFLIAVQNEQEYISPCLQSIINYFGDYLLEIIVVDDHSTDSTRAIIEKLSRRHPGIIFPYTNHSKGKVSAYNLAYSRSTGNLFTFVGGDDYIVPSDLDARANSLIENEDKPQVSYAAMQFFQNDHPEKLHRAPRFGGGNTSGGAAMFNKVLANSVFPIPEHLPNEDTWLHAIALGVVADVHCINCLSVCNRIHRNNSWNRMGNYTVVRSNIDKRYEAYSLALERIVSEGSFPGERLSAYVNANKSRLEGNFLKVSMNKKLSAREKVNLVQYCNKFFFDLTKITKVLFR